MLTFELDWRALEEAEFVFAAQFTKGNHRAGEGDGTNGCAQEQLEFVTHRNSWESAVSRFNNDAKGVRLNHHRNRDKDRSQTDHAVHEGDEFRHFGHFDLVCHISTSAAADD